MKKLNKIIKNEFIKNVATLLSGSAIAQAFLLLIMPILSRLYNEELFGYYFIFVSTFNILKQITTLRFEIAIVLPKKNKDSINILILTLLINIITTIILTTFCLFFKNIFLQIGELRKIANFIYLLPISLFLTGIFEIFNYWNNRNKNYKKIALGKIILSSSTGATQLLFGFLQKTNVGLILGQVLGQLFAAVSVLAITIKSVFENLKYVSIRRMIYLLKKYKKIPIFTSVINLANTFSSELPMYFLMGYYTPATAGFYGMANKIIGTPMNLLSQSIGQVFYQKATENFNANQNISSLVKKVYSNLLKISVLPFLLFLIISPFIHYILGNEWQGLSTYIFILLPAIFVNFISQPVSSVITIKHQQDKMFIFNLLMIFVKFSAMWLGFYLFDSAIWSIGLLTLVNTAFRIFILFWYLKISKK